MQSATAGGPAGLPRRALCVLKLWTEVKCSRNESSEGCEK